mmetsp:Transcript_10199/g.21396  ORF Transcript_10199/g.21396 Transcript_10199/m.21396 type:complete len:201 (-) Transcript_10199:786-1388(-)
MTPSQGILSPLLTATIAPIGTEVAGTTMSSFVFGWMILARSGLSLTIDLSAALALRVARASSHSEREKRKVTAAASAKSSIQTAPTTARNMRTFVSIDPRQAVRKALCAIGGIPNPTDTSPRYERRSESKDMIQNTPEMTTAGRIPLVSSLLWSAVSSSSVVSGKSQTFPSLPSSTMIVFIFVASSMELLKYFAEIKSGL